MSDVTTTSAPSSVIPWYQSRIIWLQIIGSLCTLGGMFGYQVTPDE